MANGMGPRRVFQGYPRLGEGPSEENPYPTIADAMRTIEQRGRQIGGQISGDVGQDQLYGGAGADSLPSTPDWVRTPSAAAAGLRPSQPLPIGHGKDSQLLGFLEASGVVPRLNQLLGEADPRHLLTTNPVGLGLKIWSDAQQAEIDRLRNQGYKPGGDGATYGDLAADAQLVAGSATAGALAAWAAPVAIPLGWAAGLGGALGWLGREAVTHGRDTPQGQSFDKAASGAGNHEDHLPSWLDFRPQDRPMTKVRRR